MSVIRSVLISGILLAGLFAPVCTQQAGAANADDAQTITIDAHAAGAPFPHFREQMFGSGRAKLALRASYRDDLRATRPRGRKNRLGRRDFLLGDSLLALG